jgi:hypothetical protein
MRDISPSRGRSTQIRADQQLGEPEEDGPPQLDPDIDERYRDDEDDPDNADDRPPSRATSATRRRKRGARKGKGSSSANVSVNGSTTNISAMVQTSPGPYGDEAFDLGGDHLDDMAVKSQLLARELSKTNSWMSSNPSLAAPSQISLTASLENGKENGSKTKEITPKKSRWRMFSSSNSNSDVPPVPVVPNLAGSSQVPSLYSYPYAHTSPPRHTTKTSTGSIAKSDIHSIASVTSGSAASVTSSSRSRKSNGGGGSTSSGGTTGKSSISGAQAANAASLIMALGPAPRPSSNNNPPPPSSSSVHLPSSAASSANGSSISLDRADRTRGRSDRGTIAKAAAAAMYPSTPAAWGPHPRLELVPPPSHKDRERRNLSPSTPPSSNTSSNNWRNSMSGASSSTSTTASSASAFTRYSNSSVKSFDTLATSNSGSSSNWRSGGQDAAGGKNKVNGSSASVNSGRSDGQTVPSNVKSE